MSDSGAAVRLAGSVARAGRHATWLELFFDLVYVVAVSNLATLLAGDPTPGGALRVLALLVPVWWAWIGISYFIDQFALPPLAERLLLFQQIALSLGVAVGLPGLAGGDVLLFTASYGALRATLAGLYVWAALTVPGARTLCAKYAAGFTVGTVLWVAAAAAPPGPRVALWALALTMEIACTVWAYVSTREIPQQVSHMDERFGLFTLIVLGESVLAVATGGSHVEGLAGWVVALSGVVLACAVWWLYFDRADESVINRALRGGTRALYLSFVYGYTHVLVFAAIVAASVGVEHAFEDVEHAHVSDPTRLLLCGGLLLYVLALSVVQYAEPAGLPRVLLGTRLAAALALLLLGLAGGALPPELLVAGSVGVLVALVVAEARLSPVTHGAEEIGVDAPPDRPPPAPPG